MPLTATGVRPVSSHEMSTSDGRTFMRNGPSSWEELMGQSWEPVNWPEDEEALESAYQAWVSTHGL